MGFQVAIDGPAAAGKTTAAKKIAQELGFTYIDTGAMYRAVGLYCQQNEIDTKDHEAVKSALDSIDISIQHGECVQLVFLNGRNVTGRIRTSAIGNMASDVGIIPEVRKKLVSIQKKMAKESNVIMEGRDICTNVLPDAQVKIYLTASINERAKRRHQELADKNLPCTLEELEEELRQRDHQDMNRKVSPLRKAPGAVEIDSTDMSADDVAKMIVELVRRGGTRKVVE